EAGLEAVIEAVHALARDQPLERRGVRVDHPDRAPVAALQLLEQLMGLLVQPPGIDAEHVDLGQLRRDDVGEHHRLGAEAVRVHEAPVAGEGGRELRVHRPRLPFEPERRQLRHDGADYNEAARSEEHTSELQSLRHLVCRLLLEKKKKNKNEDKTKLRSWISGMCTI